MATVQLNVIQPTTQIQAPPKATRTGHLTATDFNRFREQREHVLRKPDMYIGSNERVPRGTWILNLATTQMVHGEITFPEGAERIFLECLSNGGDNTDRSRRAGVDPGTIDVFMDRKTISIRNGGTPIPVMRHPTEDMWIPDMIFGTLLSGSNYNDNIARTVVGTFGIGAKACNIFSVQFCVIVCDHIRQLKYTQVWGNNMSVRGEPTIEPYTGPSSVQVIYTMDFPRFQYNSPDTDPTGGYPDEAIYLFARHVADISFTCKVPCTFNGVALDVQDIRSYAKLYFGETATNGVVHYQWPEGTQTTVKKGVEIAVDPNVTPIAELCIMDTPDTGLTISFINGMLTSEGGVHVNAAQKAISGPLLAAINGDDKTPKKGKGKGKPKAKTETKAVKLTLSDVQPHISMILSCRLPDPKFKSQTKTSLASPTPKIEISERAMNCVMKWNLINRLYAALAAKEDRNLAKTDGKKKRHIFVDKGQDANESGGPNSFNCTLIIVEGMSAMGYAECLISCMPQGRDYVGVCPIKGKMRNVRNATPQQIAENSEITRLKKMTGLREGVDYRTEEGLKTLRYGYICLMTDADHDGNHIKGLALNWIECRHPTLLMAGRVISYETPYLRVTKGTQMHKFYTVGEYEVWKQHQPDWETWKTKYYKGLATSKNQTVKEDYITKRMQLFHYDEKAPEALRLAFDEKLVPLRKEWIRQYNPVHTAVVDPVKSISRFINEDFIQYAVINVHRSIPSLMDGLKESQRKLLWAAMVRWASSSPDLLIVKKPEELKVSQFANYAAEKTNYHHGEVSLSGTTILMGQRYPSSNNMPYFVDDGQFGSRAHDGDDSGDPRYLFTYPEWWINYIYPKADLPLLVKVIDEGEVEPVVLLPIIPMALVNGTKGIGTGHSTFMPNHNPMDIVAWIRAKIQGQTLPAVWPWYRGFQGTLEVKQRGEKLTMEAVAQAEATEAAEEALITPEAVPETPTIAPTVPTKARLSLITKGVFNINEQGNVVVTELPIERSSQAYRDWLKTLIETKKITTFRDQAIQDVIYFEIVGFQNPTHQNLKLQRSFGMTNMVLLDAERRPVKYDTAIDILEAFYTQRLPYYEARRRYIMAEIERQIARKQAQARFIQAVISGELVVMRQKKAAILARMRELQIPHAEEILRYAKITELSEDDMTDLANEIQVLQGHFQVYQQTTDRALWLQDLQTFETAYRQHYP